ncbi:unnamed protein product [Dibothriocephalus latus]|uniref:Rho GDP-dissociation inhibitor 1 n=1 Tax=Dibothriocephalus latus TaxID=60516 RepID=A0A3P7L9S5_DIBLA|nr:unnamed protein product [Dibothriocephalus latus]
MSMENVIRMYIDRGVSAPVPQNFTATMAAPSGDDADLVPEPDLYKAPEKKTIEELVNLDADDEALKRYKENLLGSVVQTTPFPNDPRHLIVKKLEVLIKNGPTIALDLDGDLEKLKDNPIEIPEGAFYNVRVTFYVQREIIAGLRYIQSAHKGLAKSMYLCCAVGSSFTTLFVVSF